MLLGQLDKMLEVVKPCDDTPGAEPKVLNTAMLVSELVMFAFYLFFSLQHRWVDTYHAIWGFSRRHPGNKYSKSPYKDVDHK